MWKRFNCDPKVTRRINNPQILEAEQALIGSILVNNDIIDEVSNFIKPNIFYDPAHVKIYDVIQNQLDTKNEFFKK